METKKYIMLGAIVLMGIGTLALPVAAAVFIGDRSGSGTGSGTITQPGGGTGSGVPPVNGQCMAVPFIPQGGDQGFVDSWCGRASQAMVIAFFNGNAAQYSTYAFQHDHPLSTATVANLSKQPYVCSQSRDLDKAAASIQAGYPVIIYTSIYGKHIFVLTGYDEASQTFLANDTFEGANGGHEQCTPVIGGVTLTKANLTSHIAPQACSMIIVPQ